MNPKWTISFADCLNFRDSNYSWSFWFYFSGKHVRELVLYFNFAHQHQRQKGSFGIVSQNLNITVDSCSNNNKSTSSHFELKLNSLQESATYSESWLPVYTDNEDWAHIEFTCRIHIDYLMLLEGQPNRSFQLVIF